MVSTHIGSIWASIQHGNNLRIIKTYLCNNYFNVIIGDALNYILKLGANIYVLIALEFKHRILKPKNSIHNLEP
jgi:hypothetical protein